MRARRPGRRSPGSLLAAVGGRRQLGLQGECVRDHVGDRYPGLLGADLLAVADGVVGAERDQPAVGGDLLHAALHQLAHVEGVGVEEVLDHDHERIVGDPGQRFGEVDAACVGAVERLGDLGGEPGEAAVVGLGADERRGAPQLLQRLTDLVVGDHPVGDVVEVVLDLQQPGDRHQPEVGVVGVALGQQVGDGPTGRGTARHREEVLGREPLGELVGDGVQHVGVGQPGQRVERDVAPGVGDRLEGDRPDGGMGQAVSDGGSDLVLVEVPLDGRDQGDGRPASARLSSRALCLVSRRSRPRTARCVSASRPSNCR